MYFAVTLAENVQNMKPVYLYSTTKEIRQS